MAGQRKNMPVLAGSETSTVTDILAPYCVGIGCDIGYGGKKIVPEAWAFDLPHPYTKVGEDRQQLRGDCRHLSFLCDEALDYLYSSHVLEDFTYEQLRSVILPEWRRVLKHNGLLVVNCPDQQRFLAHCQRTGQPMNLAHKEPDFSLLTFKHEVLDQIGPWINEFVKPEHGAYSWLAVWRKA